MFIANPIYDVVFKYLLEDKKVAKLLLSAILEKEIIDLELKPQEYTRKREDNTLTVYRVDFKAKIKLNDGKTKVVLVELQKAKFYTDLMRFRRYLGRQYSNEDNTIKDEDEEIIEVLPIITIYFIAYSLDELKDIPIIYVKREYIDKSTNKIIDKRTEFIEALTHDSIIVQIDAIKNKKHKNRLEKILSIFDTVKSHKISINEDDYPEEYKPIIRRLIKAIADEDMEMEMEYEDYILEDIKREQRKAREAKEREREAKEREREAKEREREAKEREREAEKRAKERERELENEKKRAKEELKQQKLQTAITLLKSKVEDEIVQTSLGLTKDEIKKLKENYDFNSRTLCN